MIEVCVGFEIGIWDAVTGIVAGERISGEADAPVIVNETSDEMADETEFETAIAIWEEFVIGMRIEIETVSRIDCESQIVSETMIVMMEIAIEKKTGIEAVIWWMSGFWDDMSRLSPAPQRPVVPPVVPGTEVVHR